MNIIRKKRFDWFVVINTMLLVLAALICIIPLWHIAAISFSTSASAAAGRVTLWPVDWSLNSYVFVTKRPAFWQSIMVSFKRVFLGGGINLILAILAAYPLSKDKNELRTRSL